MKERAQFVVTRSVSRNPEPIVEEEDGWCMVGIINGLMAMSFIAGLVALCFLLCGCTRTTVMCPQGYFMSGGLCLRLESTTLKI